MKKVRKWLKTLGPGFVTGASDDDPSGIATYSQTGAIFGFSQLWTALFTLPFMLIVQEMCGRIGMVTGSGLSGVIRRHYSKRILYFAIFVLLFANTINIGANLGAMATAARLLIPLPFAIVLILMTVLTLTLEVFVSYQTYVKYLKYLALSLVSYVVVAFVIKLDWPEIAFHTFIPQIVWSQQYLMNIVAILGTTISPYLFFWQANQEAEEEVAAHKISMMGFGRPLVSNREVHQMRVDTAIGMVFSNLVMFFIIVSTASTLNASGITWIETAPQAAEALRPIAGDAAFLLFAIGIIGTGLLSVPVLAGSASYAFSEAFRWKEGLYRKFNQAHGFYGVITLATLMGLLINYLPIPPFTLLYYTAILNGICAPPLLILILLIANNKKVMGHRTNSRFSNLMGVIITATMTLAAVGLLVTSLGMF